MSRSLFVLPSIQDVLMAEDELIVREIPHELLPTPTSISSDCGMVLACEEVDLDAICKVLAELGIRIVQVAAE